MAYGYGDSVPLINPITSARAHKPYQVKSHPWYESETSEEYLARKEHFKEGLTPEK
jgi:hypothetical protein